jgi:8-oxo-dGTP pyrophosphatase MutT (NUDIX family)
MAAGVGKRVAYYRNRGGLTAKMLSDRCAQRGLRLDRNVIAKLEAGIRQSVTFDEVCVLAAALGVPPIMLLFPLGQAEQAEVLPGRTVATYDAMQWFAGDVELADGPEGQLAVIPVMAGGDYTLFRTHQRLVDHITLLNDTMDAGDRASSYVHRVRPGKPAPSPDDAAMREIEDLAVALVQIRNSIREHGLTPPQLPPKLARLDPQPVVVAVVTSAEGVLVGRRSDGNLPWGFIAGEVEPGETPAAAAAREVEEETGLLVEPGAVLGVRQHPGTRRMLIYMAAEPTDGTSVGAGDRPGLDEVRWVSLAEAEEMLPGMHEPVRDYLAKLLGG